MSERRGNGQGPDDFYRRADLALNKAIEAFARTNPNVADLGQAVFRRNLYQESVQADAGLSWEEVLLAGAAFSKTLKTHKKHPIEDEAFVSFLAEQAVRAAERDGVVASEVRILQARSTADTRTQTDIGYERLVEAVKQRAIVDATRPISAESNPSPQPNTERPSNKAKLSPEERKRVLRRRLLGLMGWGVATLVVAGGAKVGYDILKEEHERLHPYEVEHKMSSEYTPISARANLQFTYPQIEAGWDFTNNYDSKAIIRHFPSKTAYLQVALPWDNSDFPNVKIANLQEIYVNTYTDSSGKLVPKINYIDKTGISREYVLIGHISEPEGSLAKVRPDIIEIRAQGFAPLFVSMITEEVIERGGKVKNQVVRVTTLEKTRKN